MGIYSSTIDTLKFSLFFDESKGIYCTIPTETINFNRLVDIYKSPFVLKTTNEIKNETDPDKKKLLKRKLPFITPYGTFEKRETVSRKHFNSNLVCLDIDGLKENETQLVKTILCANNSTILCAVSPRGNGVKAMVLITDQIDWHNSYNQLKLNKYEIAQKLDLVDFIDKIDLAQFVLTQPFFIAHDPDIYINRDPALLDIFLIPYKEHVTKTQTDFFNDKPISKTWFVERCNPRVKLYFEKIVDEHVKFFALCVDGNRHRNIAKVQYIGSIIHYAPQLETEIKEKLLKACIEMYDSEQDAKTNNVTKSFERAWNGAYDKRNESLESILDETERSHNGR